LKNSSDSINSSPSSTDSLSVRDLSRQKFTEALGAKSDPDHLDTDFLAEQIENALYQRHNCKLDKNYASQRRTLFWNIKDEKNVELREALFSGELSPEKLVTLSTQELANNEMKAWIENSKEKYTASLQGIKPEHRGVSDMFMCGKCKQRKVIYNELQTRSADEPMTYLISCTVCGRVWKQN